jgi:hypothetical protein
LEPRTAERETSGTTVRGLLAELKSRGLFEAVRAGVSPEAQAMMDHPPLFITWVPSRRYEELLVRLWEVVGDEKAQQIVLACVVNATGPLVLPLLKTFARIAKGSPASLLKNLGKVLSVQTRGVQFDYEPETERSGYFTARYPEPISDCLFSSVQAVLRFGKEIAGPTLTVGRFEISEGGKFGRARIAW